MSEKIKDHARCNAKSFTIYLLICILLCSVPAAVFPRNIQELRIASTYEPVETGFIYSLNKPFAFQYQIATNVSSSSVEEIYNACKKGELDFMIINHRDTVDKMVAENLLAYEKLFMSNNLYIYGPSNDPCELSYSRTILDGFKILTDCNRLFFIGSRDSGIDRTQKRIFDLIGFIPIDTKFIRSGTGTEENLLLAEKNRSYCFVDSGTYNNNRSKLSGKLFCTEDKSFSNNYYACVVSEKPGGNQNLVSAMAYFGWLTSIEGQNFIENFKKNNENIFFPVTETGKISEDSQQDKDSNIFNSWETK